ncbi:MAG: polysaccharide deacetylase family protein [Phycisphaerae bacterium]|nr:polysaccharide deacetylase family protein [Gemmatimonadaceae bacterium]
MGLKQTVLSIGKATGAFAMVRGSSWRRNRLLLLCYHGISMHDEHEWNPSLYITPEKLRERLQVLRDGNYSILPLAEATRRLFDGTLPPRSVALTFDDGAVDFEQRALPVLREFNAPATVYLTTHYCEERYPVFDTVLSYVLWRGRNSKADLAGLAKSNRPLAVSSEADRSAAWQHLYDFAKASSLGTEAKNELVRQVALTLGVDFADILSRRLLQIMSADDLRKLPSPLIDVQLHTHRHRTPRDRSLFVRELEDNAKAIRKYCGSATSLKQFCYPSGDYDGRFFQWLRECGVEYATTCLPDLASRNDNPLMLPRFVDTMQQSRLSFEAWATGFAGLLPRRAEHRVNQERLTSAHAAP